MKEDTDFTMQVVGARASEIRPALPDGHPILLSTDEGQTFELCPAQTLDALSDERVVVGIEKPVARPSSSWWERLRTRITDILSQLVYHSPAVR